MDNIFAKIAVHDMLAGGAVYPMATLIASM